MIMGVKLRSTSSRFGSFYLRCYTRGNDVKCYALPVNLRAMLLLAMAKNGVPILCVRCSVVGNDTRSLSFLYAMLQTGNDREDLKKLHVLARYATSGKRLGICLFFLYVLQNNSDHHSVPSSTSTSRPKTCSDLSEQQLFLPVSQPTALELGQSRSYIWQVVAFAAGYHSGSLRVLQTAIEG